VIARRFDGMIHGFFGMGQISDAAHKAVLTLCADLKQLLG
jgi:hypothetical protein